MQEELAQEEAEKALKEAADFENRVANDWNKDWAKEKRRFTDKTPRLSRKEKEKLEKQQATQ